MKKIIIASTSLVLVLTLLLCLVSCGKEVSKEGLWENATYTEDVTLGKGEKTVTLLFEVQDQKITFTLKTDEENLGAALHEHSLLEGEDGLYTKINGITADYNTDQSYWAFYVNGEYAMKGIDDTPIDESATYSLVYTK